jgi:hypothetical protein
MQIQNAIITNAIICNICKKMQISLLDICNLHHVFTNRIRTVIAVIKYGYYSLFAY